MRSVLGVHWRDWCWSWNSNTLATWCEELTYLKRPWCWERLKVGGEGDDRGWDGWMASRTQGTWVWVGSVCWWLTGRPAMLLSMGLQRVGHDWVTELNWYQWLTNSLDPLLLLTELKIWHQQAQIRGINNGLSQSWLLHSLLPDTNSPIMSWR